MMMAGEEERAWDMLPAAALVTIFRKLGVEDRFKGAPLVCRSWNEASKNPRCWESMLAEGECPLLHFIILNDFEVISPENLTFWVIRAFIERSDGGATTLYLSGLYLSSMLCFFIAERFIDFLIRRYHRCPKLKHLSLRGCILASEAGLLKLVQSCPKLELLDLSGACPLSLAVLQEMGRCWPELRGLRRNFVTYGPEQVSAIAASFPKLQFLNLCSTNFSKRDLSTILKSCTCLLFLDVTGTWCGGFYSDKELGNMVAEIPEFTCDNMYEGGVYFSENDDEYVVYDDLTGQFPQFHEDSEDDFTGQFHVVQVHENVDDDGGGGLCDELIDRFVRARWGD